ncbi:hypothetical protein TIFTF001_018876 [Ficus carica]|uniref:Uncharacterized protein n=1 Tax=Ficus carica TaxID=3494 RepID=A0AA88DC32_FICCA|nr:hypothetical protein TIFTF001_018876 [Ficus carica]
MAAEEWSVRLTSPLINFTVSSLIPDSLILFLDKLDSSHTQVDLIEPNLVLRFAMFMLSRNTVYCSIHRKQKC